MQGSTGDSGKTRLTLRVSLPCKTPVVGIEIIPSVHVTDNERDQSEAPQYSLTYNWYQLESDDFACSVHPTKLATFQCISCVMLQIPVKESYHCSEICFVDSWPRHLKCHNEASGERGLHDYWACDDLCSFCLDNIPTFEEKVVKPMLNIGCSMTYVPTAEDVGYILRLECVAVDSITGESLTSSNVIVTDPVIAPPQPYVRRMIQVGSFDGAALAIDGSFSVLTYNILSDSLANLGSYKYCPNWALTWQYRKQYLLQEITRYDADIVCLQEVRSDHFENFFAPELDRCKYSAIYMKKTNAVYTTGKYVFDGCATFFRQDRFKEVEKHEIEFLKMTGELVDELPLTKKKAAAIRLMKDNVAVIVVLESKEGSSVTNMLQFRNRHFICVANTHIQFDPELTDVKLLQVAELLLSLDRITSSLVSRYPGAVIHVVLSGDFNSLPGSAAHQLIALRNIHPNHPELVVDPFNVLRQTKLSHNMHLASAYASLLQTSRDETDFRCQQTLMDRSTKEPLFTNFTDKFAGTLDYIFYTEDTLVVDGLLELLDEDVLSKNSALPCPIWPSDHIALMGSFRIKQKLQNPHSVS